MRRAFTLIELLVVIAIIAILAAILFPVFAQARSKARQAVCLSNMKQMGLGVMMYTTDYDEAYPPAVIRDGLGNSSPASPAVASWKSVTYPYTKNLAIYECPDLRAQFAKLYGPNETSGIYNFIEDEVASMCDPKAPAPTGNPYCAYSNGIFFVRGYSLNGAVFGNSFSIPGGFVQADCDQCNSKVATEAGIPQAAETAMICDTKSYNEDMLPGASMRCNKAIGISKGSLGLTAVADSSSPFGQRYAIGWFVDHSHGIELTYADGHVKFTRYQSALMRNDFKYDCQQNPQDQQVWPLGSFAAGTTAGNCACADGSTCAATAAAGLPFEYL